jgi:hypothetical protein
LLGQSSDKCSSGSWTGTTVFYYNRQIVANQL